MYNDSRRDLFYVVTISALIHLILIVLILLSKIDSSVRDFKIALEKKRNKKEAKVIFKQPKPKKRLIPKLTAGSASPLSSPPLPQAKPPKPKSPKLPKPEETKPVEKAVKKNPEPKSTKQQIERTIEQKTKTPLIKNMPELKHASLYKQKEKTLPKNPILEPKSAKPNKPKPPEKKSESTSSYAQEKKAVSDKKVTLVDITKGFMEYARRENTLKSPPSNHLISVIGKNFGKATSEQLKHERYIKKLFDCVDVSFKLLKRSFRFTLIPQTEILTLYLFIDLDKKGRIASLKLVEPSGNTQFDIFMTKVFKDAARSFPPVPSSFNTEIYSLPIQCTIPVGALRPERQQMCV